MLRALWSVQKHPKFNYKLLQIYFLYLRAICKSKKYLKSCLARHQLQKSKYPNVNNALIIIVGMEFFMEKGLNLSQSDREYGY